MSRVPPVGVASPTGDIKKRQDSEKCGLGVSPSEAPFQDRGVGGEGKIDG